MAWGRYFWILQGQLAATIHASAEVGRSSKSAARPLSRFSRDRTPTPLTSGWSCPLNPPPGHREASFFMLVCATNRRRPLAIEPTTAAAITNGSALGPPRRPGLGTAEVSHTVDMPSAVTLTIKATMEILDDGTVSAPSGVEWTFSDHPYRTTTCSPGPSTTRSKRPLRAPWTRRWRRPDHGTSPEELIVVKKGHSNSEGIFGEVSGVQQLIQAAGCPIDCASDSTVPSSFRPVER